ncbi:MAG: hypothetical protein H0U73_05595, partial [Tatlockia sp.]|nr:hypothetical protein [Tatlockia sp.]
MKKYILLSLGLFVAASDGFSQKSIIAPQPTSCISSVFSSIGDQHWQEISLKLTNKCNQTVDFQNSAITFINKANLNTSFWGDFSELSWPVNTLITSQLQTEGNFLSTIGLQFRQEEKHNLPNGASLTIQYGQSSADFVADSVKVYLNSTPATGSINLTNSTAKPASLLQNYALVDLTLNGQKVSQVQLPWSGQQLVSGLAAGTYAISPQNITDSTGLVYLGSANPATVALASGTTAPSVISYKASQPTGAIKLSLQTLPTQLAGYTQQPSVTLKSATNNSTLATVQWGSSAVVNSLVSGVSYSFTTPAIIYNGYKCLPTFNPINATAASTPPTVNLTYTCTQIALNNVSVSISGAPTTTTSVNVSFTPTGNSAPIVQTITMSNGAGSGVVQLTEGGIYTVSADDLNGYTASYAPQPLTATAEAKESITYKQKTSSGGRIIAFLPGWKTPPPASAIANAGYTHVMIAFGVFNTRTPGQITPAFDTVTAAYIKSLQNVGIKVLLSLGGALTSIPDTTVNFHDVLVLAPTPTAFIQTFNASMENLINLYGFDGFDIDIEHGLNGGGTFTNPTGDIAVLANIINTMHNKYPNLLITLTPQIANVAATRGFDGIWGNYASLIMQTHQSLAWVGIEVYNSGCAYGIDLICYDPNITTTPDASVAFAVDLLANWPTKTSSGQTTGFQPYISNLRPDQVVLGYPSP